MIKHLWIVQAWGIRWALCNDPYVGVEIWEEYRHALNPKDNRDLVDMIAEDYSCDVDRMLQENAIAFVICWVRRRLTNWAG